ncbi:hypothetical protein P389DRAFT_181527 [Cystobasidium minutum MCA 4210]|uniref:uncharacterized protein n=1 Tax=Cystobasidium minutum MCA 4210 TaxID=1397322 RepID=UPI0034CF490D|eukprot:jgi/Rhomi1/181527/fgenesh1_pg.7_\
MFSIVKVLNRMVRVSDLPWQASMQDPTIDSMSMILLGLAVAIGDLWHASEPAGHLGSGDTPTPYDILLSCEDYFFGAWLGTALFASIIYLVDKFLFGEAEQMMVPGANCMRYKAELWALNVFNWYCQLVFAVAAVFLVDKIHALEPFWTMLWKEAREIRQLAIWAGIIYTQLILWASRRRR